MSLLRNNSSTLVCGGFLAALVWVVAAATPASCAHAEQPPAPSNPADNVECYWSTHHGLCLCSGNWHDQSPHFVVTAAKTAKACL